MKRCPQSLFFRFFLPSGTAQQEAGYPSWCFPNFNPLFLWAQMKVTILAWKQIKKSRKKGVGVNEQGGEDLSAWDMNGMECRKEKAKMDEKE